jgi:hypothetical protein
MFTRPSFIASAGMLFGIVAAVLLILAPPDWWIGQLDPLWRAAYALRHASSFDLPCAATPATVPPVVTAWRVVDASPKADSIFKELVYSDDIRYPALLYGLAGVYATDSAFFRSNMPRVSLTNDSVHVTEDCVARWQPVASSTADLRSGRWTYQLRGVLEAISNR